jgi:tellurite methyltransferase
MIGNMRTPIIIGAWNLLLSPSKLVNLMQSELPHGKRLLDIGSGEGRDAIYFAKSGFTVDALELSLPGVEKIKQYSQTTGCKVNVIQANMIRNQRPPSGF